jgi:hypothetical protein
MTLEISLETRGCEFLIREGALPEKMGQDGKPDRLVLWGNGHHFWIEWKKPPSPGHPSGRIRPGQKTYAKYLRAIGDEVHFIDNFVQLVEVVKTFRLIHGPATASRDKVFNP